jgi:hypothetical protein
LFSTHPSAAIECGYHGKVGALHKNGEYFIISPNMDYIPEPANNSKVVFRTDCRLGDDDHLQWPQLYLEHLCHFPLIPRRDPDTRPDDPLAVLLFPYEEEFFVSNRTATLVGLGFLRPDVLARLKQIYEDFERQKLGYDNEPNYSRTPFVEAGMAGIRRSIGHLERLPMTHRQLKFIFAETQRHMLEFVALLRFITDVQPKMRQLKNHTGEPMKMVGAFFNNPSDADVYFRAGIPVWLICAANKAGVLRVDALIETTKPADILIMTPELVDHKGAYYSGTPDVRKYDFFRVYLRRYLTGSNPLKAPQDGIQSSFGPLASSSLVDPKQSSSAGTSGSSLQPSSAPSPTQALVSRSSKYEKSTPSYRTQPCMYYNSELPAE